MKYIFIDGQEAVGNSITLPHKIPHGVIGRNTPIPVLRHKHSLIPCETIAAETRADAGITISETGETVRYTEAVPKVIDGETQRDDDGNIIYEDRHHDYQGLLATEAVYTPSLEEQLQDILPYFSYLMETLSNYGI